MNSGAFPFEALFDDIDDKHWFKQKLFMSTLEKHAPSKIRTIHKNQVPYMNSRLRKSINQRNMWRGKHFRNRNNKEFRTRYVKMRNKVVKLRNASIKNYFMTRCDEQASPKQFFKTVKPFLSNKSNCCNDKIILREKDDIISKPSEVAQIFNMYYASVAKYTNDYDGLDELDFNLAVRKHSQHSSVTLIINTVTPTTSFSFSHVTVDTFKKYINRLNCKKAVGHDDMQPFFLKLAGDNCINSLCGLYNSCISSCSFPTSLKRLK